MLYTLWGQTHLNLKFYILFPLQDPSVLQHEIIKCTVVSWIKTQHGLISIGSFKSFFSHIDSSWSQSLRHYTMALSLKNSVILTSGTILVFLSRKTRECLAKKTWSRRQWLGCAADRMTGTFDSYLSRRWSVALESQCDHCHLQC